MAFEQLKERQSTMWGSAPYERVSEHLAGMHDALVERLEPQQGMQWLDVASGTGEVSLRAARRGAHVVGVDFAPPLVESARRNAAEKGLDVRFEVGDAERLGFDDAEFDVVTSSIGAMFAPDQEAVARELARVCRPGGRLGLTTWTPEGRIGAMFRVLAEFQPPPPPGVRSPLEWGREERLRELLSGTFEIDVEERDVPFEIESGEDAWELFSEAFAPLRTLAGQLEPDRREELRRAWIDFHEEDRVGDRIRQSRAYLLVVGTRR